ncbi:sigma-54 interaction domain-containing protein [Sediminibacillus massiliensis]|uniref:sigma-54 interaction domain-containing protein n=1 Tax=Sediminibacillus massiliensis TaxID=1926277 RepID=UPI00098890FE|nr:sigma 54-interacting transcriptional regulator [Sediminibacillus massiliensis]
MKHLLPSIKELIQTDFIYWDKASAPSAPPPNNIGAKILFINHPDRLIAQTINDIQHLNNPNKSLPAYTAQIIDIHDSWKDIQIKITECDYLLVTESSTPIGYMKVSTLASTTLYSYIYLKAYYDTILDTTDSSISVINDSYETVVWTTGAERIFSIKRKDIIGKPMTDFFPEKMLENIITLQKGESVRRKQHQPREDLFVLINTNPVKIGDKIVGVVVSETDVTKQVHLSEKLVNANKTIQDLRHKVLGETSPNPFRSIVGTSYAVQKTIQKVRQIGTTEARVLFYGESGVGKELFAKAIHELRNDKNAPFVAVNCGAIPASLFESELFGYEKGAFSGANSQGKKGQFELAKGGTLFLDEVGELPLDMQVKLLRVLQEGTFYSVGGTKVKKVNCQIISATNKNLQKLVELGEFREDLYYRLNIVSIKIPPLRERMDDIMELSHMFLYEFSERYDREVHEIPKSIMQKLMNYHWPGNIRELRNTMERLVVFSTEGKLDAEDLPSKMIMSQDNQEEIRHIDPSPAATIDEESILPLKTALEEFEKDYIKQALLKTENKNKVADMLGVSRATLYNKINKLGL